MTERTRKYIFWGYLVIALAGGVLSRIYGHDLFTLLPSTADRAQTLSLRSLLTLAGFISVFAVTVFFSAPTNSLFYLAAGYFFGLATGTIAAAAATLLGSEAAFLFFKKALAPHRSSRDPENVFFTLVLLRCSPWFPSSLVNLYSGSRRVPRGIFSASTMLGTLPLILIYTLTASRLRGPITLSILYSPEILTAVSVLGAISLVGFLQPVRAVVTLCAAQASHGKKSPGVVSGPVREPA
jgi:uncharacterized membrane protein YdjX (TVP38/TMEM64 family)